MKGAVRVVGALWILQAAVLTTEELMRVAKREAGVSLGIALLLYAIVLVVGVWIMARARGWTIVAVVAAIYQGISHFIYLSNMWPQIDYSAGFSLFVDCLAVATLALAVAQWRAKDSTLSTAPSNH